MTVDYWQKILNKLVLGTILASIKDSPSDEEQSMGINEDYYGLLIELPNKKKVELIFLRDEEGNGAGRFEVLEVD